MGTKISLLDALAEEAIGDDLVALVHDGETYKAELDQVRVPIVAGVVSADWGYHGTLAVVPASHRRVVRQASTIRWAAATLGTTSGSGSVVATVYVNGASSFTLTIPAGDTVVEATPDVALSALDQLTVAITSAGTNAADLTVSLEIS